MHSGRPADQRAADEGKAFVAEVTMWAADEQSPAKAVGDERAAELVAAGAVADLRSDAGVFEHGEKVGAAGRDVEQDERLVGEVVHVDPLVARAWVVGGQQDIGGGRVDELHLDAGADVGGKHDSDLAAAVQQRLFDVRLVGLDEVQLNLGVDLGEALDQAGKDKCRGGAVAADGQSAV